MLIQGTGQEALPGLEYPDTRNWLLVTLAAVDLAGSTHIPDFDYCPTAGHHRKTARVTINRFHRAFVVELHSRTLLHTEVPELDFSIIARRGYIVLLQALNGLDVVTMSPRERMHNGTRAYIELPDGHIVASGVQIIEAAVVECVHSLLVVIEATQSQPMLHVQHLHHTRLHSHCEHPSIRASAQRSHVLLKLRKYLCSLVFASGVHLNDVACCIEHVILSVVIAGDAGDSIWLLLLKCLLELRPVLPFGGLAGHCPGALLNLKRNEAELAHRINNNCLLLIDNLSKI